MTITEHFEGNVLILTVEGRMDASSVSEFKLRGKTLVGSGQTRFVLDLSELRFLDSSGLGALVSTLRLAGQAGGDVKLAHLKPEMKSLFALTRLNKVFEIHETVESAVAAF